MLQYKFSNHIDKSTHSYIMEIDDAFTSLEILESLVNTNDYNAVIGRMNRLAKMYNGANFAAKHAKITQITFNQNDELIMVQFNDLAIVLRGSEFKNVCSEYQLFDPNATNVYLAQIVDDNGNVVKEFSEKSSMDFITWKHTIALAKLSPRGQSMQCFINGEQQFTH